MQVKLTGSVLPIDQGAASCWLWGAPPGAQVPDSGLNAQGEQLYKAGSFTLILSACSAASTSCMASASQGSGSRSVPATLLQWDSAAPAEGQQRADKEPRARTP